MNGKMSVGALIVVVGLVASASGQSAPTADVRLKKAGTLLEGVPNAGPFITTEDKSKNEKAADELVTLRRQFAEMVKSYQSSRGVNGAETEWKNQFSEVERTLARLIGGGSQLPSATVGAAVVVTGANAADGISPAAAPVPGTPVAGAPTNGAPVARDSVGGGVVPTAGAIATDKGNVAADPSNPPVAAAGTAGAAPGAVGTTGVGAAPNQVVVPRDNAAAGDSVVEIAAAKVSMIGMKDLDPVIRRQLEEFRVELEMFYTAPVGSGGQ